MVVIKLQDISELDPDTPVMSIEGVRKPPPAKQGKVWVLSQSADKAASDGSKAADHRSTESGSQYHADRFALTSDVTPKAISSTPDRSFTARNDRSGDRGL
jgi:hypothetical protein